MVSGQKKNTQTVQQGNLISFTWSARLEEHLGTINAHIERPYPLLNYNDYSKILAISSACSIFDKILPERENMENLFLDFVDFLDQLDSPDWLKNYCIFESQILSDCGFGFDLSCCAITGEVEDLYYISPKTGAASTREAGEKYKDKLFIIPEFFLEKDVEPTISDIMQALNLTRYFLAKSFFADDNERIPSPAASFVEEVMKMRDNERENGNREYN